MISPVHRQSIVDADALPFWTISENPTREFRRVLLDDLDALSVEPPSMTQIQCWDNPVPGQSELSAQERRQIEVWGEMETSG